MALSLSALALAASVLACGLWFVPQTPLVPERANGRLTAMCAWARNGQMGLWWNANLGPARALRNHYRQQSVCWVVPWSSVLPSTGRPAVKIQFPKLELAP